MAVEITEILNKQPGESVVYHRGNLVYDRGGILPQKYRTPEHDAIDASATIAWSLYMAGKVHLVQRRLGANDYEYIAVRRVG